MTNKLNEEILFTEEERDERYFANALILDASIQLERSLEESGLSQKELAERLGSTESYVSQVLGGGRNVTLKTLGRFAYHLGYSLKLRRSSLSEEKRQQWQTAYRPVLPVNVSRARPQLQVIAA